MMRPSDVVKGLADQVYPNPEPERTRLRLPSASDLSVLDL